MKGSFKDVDLNTGRKKQDKECKKIGGQVEVQLIATNLYRAMLKKGVENKKVIKMKNDMDGKKLNHKSAKKTVNAQNCTF